MRLHYLDGIRGWGAFAVLLYHSFWECFGTLFPELRTGALAMVANGPLAVSIFFILSGDALLTPFLSKGNIEVLRTTAFRRYARLTVPIFLACTLSFLVMRLGLPQNAHAGEIVRRADWLGSFANFDPSVFSLINYSLYSVYFDTSYSKVYNPFLWTMPIEMLGSALIFLFGWFIPKLKYPARTAMVLAAFFYFFKSYYALFFLGALFSILRRDNRLQPSGLFTTRVLPLALLGLVQWSCTISPDISNESLWTNALRAAAFMLAAHLGSDVIAFMSSRVSKFLGHISFPLYLVHYLVLITVTSRAIVWADSKGMLTQTTALAICGVTIVTSVALATIFARVELAALKWVNAQLDRVRTP